MASTIEDINKKIKINALTKRDPLENFPEKLINPFEEALNTNILALNTYK